MGKSTVTKLAEVLLEAAGVDVLTGGNIGRPALDLLSDPEPACYLLELSSFQLETTSSLVTEVAAILNISPDHMDRYPDLNAYAAAKTSIARSAVTLVLNRDDPTLASLAANDNGPKCGDLRFEPSAFGKRSWSGSAELCRLVDPRRRDAAACSRSQD